jgi:hypothetical protein
MLAGVAQGLSLAEAGRRAGYAHLRAYERLKLEIPGRLDALGCPVDKVLKMIIEELDAEETKLGWHKGRLVQAVNIAAHDIRLRAAEILLELHNAYPGAGNRQQGDDGDTATRGPYFTVAVADPGVAERVQEKPAARKDSLLAARVGEALDSDEGPTRKRQGLLAAFD